mgnify:CR=1 FL=1|tara:strand:- start:744 stop:1064 length:321 start_codon:yes stop_codon:yes gene_type:complete
MKKYNTLILLNLILMIFTSCSLVKEGFSSQKKNSSDEFLVEKKSPLVMPPNYGELPVPKNEKLPQNLKKNDIKALITKTKKNSKNSSFQENIKKTFEDSLIDKIKE